MRILITGANGFIGRNLSLHLKEMKDITVLKFSRDNSFSELSQMCSEADFVVHLAGINRPENDEEFYEGNNGLTTILCGMLSSTGRQVPIILASSIQVKNNNPYGKSKLASENAVISYSTSTGSNIYICRLPNVFGKWCKPNYNSVVATFCYNISHNIPIKINSRIAELKLVYIDDVIASFTSIITNKYNYDMYCEVEPSYTMSVGELADQLYKFKKSRNSLISERVGDGLLRALYATYVSYMTPENFVYKVPKYGDERGDFVEILKTQDSGQFSFFTAHPGVTRGGHYHHSKTEKFLVVKGKAKFRFRHIIINEYHEIITSSNAPEIVETIPGWSHSITNIGDGEMVVILWVNEIYNREKPDTYTFPV